jgi:hypothetical protein
MAKVNREVPRRCNGRPYCFASSSRSAHVVIRPERSNPPPAILSPLNKLVPMKANEVIDQIRALPPEKQAKVVDFIEEVKAMQRIRHADRASFADAAQWVFDEHAELMRKLGQ